MLIRRCDSIRVLGGIADLKEMHWNEKIDLIKKKYSDTEFSVPHVNRKEVLRKIETKFISRTEEYYDLNNLNERFCNWWNNLKSPLELIVESTCHPLLNSLISSNEQFWIAFEFSNGIMIYKSNLKAMIELSSIGQTQTQTQTQTFHIIQLKYDHLISFRLEKNRIKIKASGSREFKDKIKQITKTWMKS